MLQKICDNLQDYTFIEACSDWLKLSDIECKYCYISDRWTDERANT